MQWQLLLADLLFGKAYPYTTRIQPDALFSQHFLHLPALLGWQVLHLSQKNLYGGYGLITDPNLMLTDFP
ncbi:hypothetical protein NCCP436_02510 [Pseudomonas sp. NCCP-436]|nr:hypothetical protein NCCP436_02510 [Pseudomonas sp. NCCP-436]